MIGIAQRPGTGVRTAFVPRGPLGKAVLNRVTAPLEEDSVLDVGAIEHLEAVVASAVGRSADIVRDDDVQSTLFLLYALSYGSFGQFGAEREWDLPLLRVRTLIENAFEQALRLRVTVPVVDEPRSDVVAAALFTLTEPTPGPSLARYVEKRATAAQVREFFIQRSIYTLREADPHSWAIPRLAGSAKAALVEIQSDEYGSGMPDRMHSALFARAMRGVGLDDEYGAYLDDVDALILASQNMMSMFGLNRRLLGAIVGHLAAFEMTSSLPNRRYADGMRRLGFAADVTQYFDEHVEADAVHEQIAAHDLAGGLAQSHPELVPDIMFGAAACLAVDGWAADHIQDRWEQGATALRPTARGQDGQ